MATNRHKPEEIDSKLRQADVLVGQGRHRIPAGTDYRADVLSLAEAVRRHGHGSTQRAETASERE